MITSPDALDGAKVIQWAWSGDRPFGYISTGTNTQIEIYGLAICQYEKSANVYRFSCNKDWEVQQDASYNSVEEALERLPDQYKQVVAKWHAK